MAHLLNAYLGLLDDLRAAGFGFRPMPRPHIGVRYSLVGAQVAVAEV